VAYQLSAQAERAVLEAAIEDAVMFIVLSYNQGKSSISISYLCVHSPTLFSHFPTPFSISIYPRAVMSIVLSYNQGKASSPYFYILPFLICYSYDLTILYHHLYIYIYICIYTFINIHICIHILILTQFHFYRIS
jgi:hypothetical protein